MASLENTMEDELKSYKSKYEVAMDFADTCQSANEALHKQIASLNEQLSQLSQALISQTDQKNEKDGETGALNTKLDELKEQLFTLKTEKLAEINELKKQLAVKESQLELKERHQSACLDFVEEPERSEDNEDYKLKYEQLKQRCAQLTQQAVDTSKVENEPGKMVLEAKTRVELVHYYEKEERLHTETKQKIDALASQVQSMKEDLKEAIKGCDERKSIKRKLKKVEDERDSEVLQHNQEYENQRQKYKAFKAEANAENFLLEEKFTNLKEEHRVYKQKHEQDVELLTKKIEEKEKNERTCEGSEQELARSCDK